MGCINNKMLCMLLLTLAHARRMYQIRKFQEAEMRRRAMRPCNATDLAQGLRGTWRLSPFARGDAYGKCVPAGCASYFDGCNTCNVGAVLGCTMMFCDKPQEPKCLAYVGETEKN